GTSLYSFDPDGPWLEPNTRSSDLNATRFRPGAAIVGAGYFSPTANRRYRHRSNNRNLKPHQTHSVDNRVNLYAHWRPVARHSSGATTVSNYLVQPASGRFVKRCHGKGAETCPADVSRIDHNRFSRHSPDLRIVAAEPDPPIARGGDGDLPRAGNSLREFYSSVYDSVGFAVGRIGSFVDTAAFRA